MRPLARLFCILILIYPVGCSTQKLAVRVTGGILTNGIAALYEESDLQLAEQAIGSNLKLLEALLRSDPENEKLQLMLAEGYTGYALGFVEDESPQRASRFYLRARDFALKVLKKKDVFRKNLSSDLNSFKTALKSLEKSDVPALFWAANAWGSYINLNKTDVQALSELPRVEEMMRRVLELDETFYYGSAHLVLGTILASKPRMLGGNPEKAREHFESCLRINHDAFLLAKYFYAATYAVQIQDRVLFRKLLNEILTAPDDILPEQHLVNQIARKKAKKLLDKEEDLFL